MKIIVVCFILGFISFSSGLPTNSEEIISRENLTLTPPVPIIADGDLLNKEYYYEVAILSTDTKPVKLCSGALLTPGWVLTSAFCAKRRPILRVQYGSNTIILQGGQLVNKIYCHPYYNPTYLHHDIALLELNPAATGNFITKVLLPTTVNENYVGKLAIISGWGAYGSNRPYDFWLSFKQTTIIDNGYCTREGHTMTPYKLCTEDRAVCEGDQGAPLVIGNTIVGIASAALEANKCDGQVVTAYTRISYYIGWIQQITRISSCNLC